MNWRRFMIGFIVVTTAVAALGLIVAGVTWVIVTFNDYGIFVVSALVAGIMGGILHGAELYD